MGGSSDAATLRSDPGGGPLALFVAGPSGSSRHLLTPSSVLLVGRGPSCGIVLDDPRVSRVHAAIDTSQPMALRDLGSANGTFLGPRRLDSDHSQPLALGDTFFAGDTALVLGPSGLGPVPAERFLGASRLDAIEARPIVRRMTEGDPAASGTALITARLSSPAHVPWAEMILAQMCQGSDDWIVGLDDTRVTVGLQRRTCADLVGLERDALSRLASWGLRATVQSTCVPVVDGESGPTVVPSFQRGDEAGRSLDPRPVFRDRAMTEVLRTAARAAAAPINVLIRGETGVGKDVVASLIQRLSPRADKPFLRLNCAALPDGLIESELFGHERGAFTGAAGTKLGLLESAEGGTVFLDEIGDMALPVQAKLLHALEAREVTRVGGLRPRRIDVRFLAATNVSLEEAVRAGRFREDLYYRISGVVISIPALRQRRADIEPLARAFAAEACHRFQIPRCELSLETIEALEAHPWPGNVREMKNAIERAVLMADTLELHPRHLGLKGVAEGLWGPAPDEAAVALSLRDALDLCGGNQSRAAKMLGVSRRTIVRRIAALRLPRPRSGTC